MKTISTKKRTLISADDEAAVTDIRIAPDGRVFVFGTSRPVLEMLSELGWGDAAVAARIHALQPNATDRNMTAEPTTCTPGPCGLGDLSNEESTDPQGVGLHAIDHQESAP